MYEKLRAGTSFRATNDYGGNCEYRVENINGDKNSSVKQLLEEYFEDEIMLYLINVTYCESPVVKPLSWFNKYFTMYC